MARQDGPFPITGTIGGICFYQMDGKYYARAKSSLSGKRVKKDPAFFATMAFASLLGRSSRIAAKLKSGLTVQQRKEINHSKLTGQVQRLLKEGKTETEIIAYFRPDLAPPVVTVDAPAEQKKVVPAEEAIKGALFEEERVELNRSNSDSLMVVERLMNSCLEFRVEKLRG